MKLFFLYPGYFYPALVAMVILVFFYLRKKFAFRDFSYLYLVQKAYQQLSIWERLRNHLLLFVRLGILFFVAAIFARPFAFWQAPHQKASGIDLVIGLDNSFSLGWTSSGQSNLERAKKLVSQLKKILPENAAIYLFSFGEVVNWASEKFTYSEEELDRWVKMIDQKSEETNLAVAIQQAQKILKNRPTPNKVVLILTDGQKAFLEKENYRRDFLTALSLIDREKVIVLEVNPEKLPNRSIAHLEMTGSYLIGRINNYGFSEEESVFWTIRGPEKIISRKTFRFKKGKKTEEISFNQADLPEWGILEISDDNLSGDNFGYFSLPPATSSSILIFDGDPQFGSVRSESFYLRQALSSLGYYYKIATEKDFNPETLKKYRWIILANWRLTEKEEKVIEEYLNAGGKIIVFAGDKINPDIYNQADWLAVSIGDVLPEKETVVPLFMPDSFLPWPDFDWEKISVRAFAVQVKKDSQQFLALKSARPLLVGNNYGYFVATSADRDWGNLAIKPAYSCILEKMLSKQETAFAIPQMLNTGELRVFKNSVVISRNNQIKTLPANVEQLLKYSSSGWKELSLPVVLKEPGIYRISARIDTRQVNPVIAINFPEDFSESNLEKFTPEEFRRISQKKIYYLTEKQLSRVREIILGKSRATTFWLLLVIFLELEFFLGLR